MQAHDPYPTAENVTHSYRQNFILAMISVHYAHPMCPFWFLLPWNVHCVIHLDQSFHNK